MTLSDDSRQLPSGTVKKRTTSIRFWRGNLLFFYYYYYSKNIGKEQRSVPRAEHLVWNFLAPPHFGQVTASHKCWERRWPSSGSYQPHKRSSNLSPFFKSQTMVSLASVSRIWLWNSAVRPRVCWGISSCIAVEANLRFAVSASALAYGNWCRLCIWMVLVLTGYSSASSFIIFVSDGNLSSFQSFWYLLLPQVSVVYKGFPWLGVNVTCFYVTLAYIIKA